MGEKYGDLTKGCLEAVELFARKEGIMLDYVYSGKAAAGLIDFARKGDFSKNENILFIHTGGNVGLFR
jgi:L-cysteate sulfo-lyase